MTDSRVALGMDRLPWLTDEPVRPAAPSQPTKAAGGGMLGWAFVVLLVVAGLAYWVGQRSVEDLAPAGQSALTQPQASAVLPPATTPAPPVEAQPIPSPKVEPMVAPAIPVVESQPVAPRAAPVERVQVTDEPAPAGTADETASTADESISAAPTPAKPVFTGPWPVRVVDGASGRLVRVGAFRTPRLAKKGWWAIVKMNPTLKHLPALVVPVQSLRDGRVYYRLQMGTTSQAHSTVLCQRMRMIAQSCVVIDERRTTA